MRLGSSISVPAPNSAHLRREAPTQQQQQQPSAKTLLTPFRTESINSSNSSSFQVESSNSERESISPSRIDSSSDQQVYTVFENFLKSLIFESEVSEGVFQKNTLGYFFFYLCKFSSMIFFERFSNIVGIVYPTENAIIPKVVLVLPTQLYGYWWIFYGLNELENLAEHSIDNTADL